jgi:hypothetical protein
MQNQEWEVQLSDNERKILSLALAHLAVYLPTWKQKLRRIATKLKGENLFDEARSLRNITEAVKLISNPLAKPS